jgi:DNA-binding protein YbaB
MKLKNTFVTHDTGDGLLMISAGGDFNGMVRSNSTAKDIINMLAKDTTEEKIIAAMLEKYEATREQVEKDVKSVLETLRKIGALDE